MNRLIQFTIAFCCLAALARGQDAASVVGTVTDPSGSVIAGAKVTVSDTAKGISRVVESDSAGAFTAAKVPIGTYTITVEAQGFERFVESGLELAVGQTVRADVQLRLGSSTEHVTVTSSAVRVETENGTISDVITGSQVSQLNLNGRNFTNLATLIPGAAAGTYDPTSVGVLASSAISFNGAPTQYNSWEIDGTNNTDQGAGGTANMVYPNVDAIAEFRIYTSIYDASIGKNAGATIELATKSGTQQFHGTLFEFVRNDDMDANDFFLNRTIEPAGQTAPKTPLKRNDFGFTIGGPVFIPKVYNRDKNKTFFFWSEEWRRNREGTVINQTVPTTRMRTGDFSECDPASANYNAIVASNCVVPLNPATGTPYAGDTVPVTPQAKAMLNALIPLPNNGIDTYTSALSLPTNFRDDIIRIDQNINSKTQLFLRLIQDAYTQTFTPTLWSNANFDTVDTLWTSPAKSAVAHVTTMLKPTLLNEASFSFSSDVNTVNQTAGASSPAGSILKPTGWSATNIMPGNATNPLIPGVSVCGGVPFCMAESTGFNYYYYGPILTFKDNVVWSIGTHNVKFGVYLQHSHLDQSEDGGPTQGFYSFTNSNPNTTGNALADMYLGQIASYTENGTVVNGQYVGGYAAGKWLQWDFESYLQDDWHVSKKLTLNIGARYYLPTQYADSSSYHMDSTFFPNLYNPAAEAQLDSAGNLIPGTGHTYLTYGNGLYQCGVGTVHSGCQEPFRTGLAPRFGFAWDPTGSGKTAVRGGYGISYDVANGNEGAAGFTGNPPVVANPTIYNVTGYNTAAAGAIAPSSMSIINYQAKFPSVQQFSLGVQHEFPGNNFLSVSYVGSLGRHLLQDRNINQVYPGTNTATVPSLAGTPGCSSTGVCNVPYVLTNSLEPSIYFVPYRGYSNITLRAWDGASEYNSLQADYRHTVGHGLTFQAAYTWSHMLDNVGGSGVNDYDMSRWWATSSLNQSQMLILNYTYEIPFFTNSKYALARSVLGGWQLSGITSFLSGQPIDFYCGIGGMSSSVGGQVRCNTIGSFQVQKGVTDDPRYGPTATWFNPGAIEQITIPQLYANGEPGELGYMGRNPIAGPGRNDWDLALLKNFKAPWFGGETSALQFRLETFNTFNHTQWKTVQAGCGSETPAGAPCSGEADNLGNGEVTSAWPARVIQLGLKFIF